MANESSTKQSSEADIPGDGSAMLELLRNLQNRGVRKKVAMIRHGAREFVPGRHDLENPLTDEGRQQSRAFGQRLGSGYRLRGYASPAQRCIDTAHNILSGYAEAGGVVTRTRPMEGLGVFYVLDQMRMYRAMGDAGGIGSFLDRWFSGAVGPDVMLPAPIAARSLLQLLEARLADIGSETGVDLLVSHDLTLYLLRHQLLKQTKDGVGPVSFLDGMLLFEENGRRFLQSPHGPAIPVDMI